MNVVDDHWKQRLGATRDTDLAVPVRIQVVSDLA